MTDLCIIDEVFSEETVNNLINRSVMQLGKIPQEFPSAALITLIIIAGMFEIYFDRI